MHNRTKKRLIRKWEDEKLVPKKIPFSKIDLDKMDLVSLVKSELNGLILSPDTSFEIKSKILCKSCMTFHYDDDECNYN